MMHGLKRKNIQDIPKRFDILANVRKQSVVMSTCRIVEVAFQTYVVGNTNINSIPKSGLPYILKELDPALFDRYSELYWILRKEHVKSSPLCALIVNLIITHFNVSHIQGIARKFALQHGLYMYKDLRNLFVPAEILSLMDVGRKYSMVNYLNNLLGNFVDGWSSSVEKIMGDWRARESALEIIEQQTEETEALIPPDDYEITAMERILFR
jgi:hypothetical protein